MSSCSCTCTAELIYKSGASGPGKPRIAVFINRPFDWPSWLAATLAIGIDGNSGLKFENTALAYQAATDELGVMMVLYAFVEDDLRAGRLVAPLALRVPTTRAYVLAWHPNRLQPARLQAFEDWVLKEAADVQSRFP